MDELKIKIHNMVVNITVTSELRSCFLKNICKYLNKILSFNN